MPISLVVLTFISCNSCNFLAFILCNSYTACLKTSLLSHLPCLNKVDWLIDWWIDWTTTNFMRGGGGRVVGFSGTELSELVTTSNLGWWEHWICGENVMTVLYRFLMLFWHLIYLFSQQSLNTSLRCIAKWRQTVAPFQRHYNSSSRHIH